MTATISSAAVMRAVGCTHRQLDYWCKAGLLGESVVGNGSGTRRRFTAAQVRMVTFIAMLSPLGADGPVIASALGWLSGLSEGEWRGLVVIDRWGGVHPKLRRGTAGWVVDLGACVSPALVAA